MVSFEAKSALDLHGHHRIGSERPRTIDALIPARSGLTGVEAARLLASVGPNTVADVAQHPARRALRKLWAPVPWMLEAAIVLQLATGKYAEAGVVTMLLLTNAGLGYFQEGRAQATLDALKARLALVAAVRRDGAWTTVPVATLVPGDMVKLSLGSVVPADVQLDSGSVLIDQSMLTGESIAVESSPQKTTLAVVLDEVKSVLFRVLHIT